jgi:hypothetical protein
MAAGPQRPRDAASNFDYWLRRCEGFRVDAPQGRVGFVEEVRYASRLDRPDVIAVRVGLLARLLLIVPVGEVAEILPREERIVLHRSPRQEMTPDVEASTEPSAEEPSAEEPSAEEQAGEKPAAEATPAEAAAEAVLAEEPEPAEEPPVEEQRGGEQTTT